MSFCDFLIEILRIHSRNIGKKHRKQQFAWPAQPCPRSVAPADSSSAAGSAVAVAAVTSSAEVTKQRIMLKDEVAVLALALLVSVRSLSLGHGGKKTCSLSCESEIRTGNALINLDIHKFWNVIMPYSKKSIGGNSFCEELFLRQFWRKKPNEYQEFKILVLMVL